MNRRFAGLFIALLSSVAHADSTALSIEDPWVRAMPSSSSMSAAYMRVINSGSQTITVTGVSAEGVAKASLHETRRVDGSVSMQAVDSLTVTPGEQVEFAPGGRHIMLMGLERSLVVGDTLELCLSTDTGPYCTTVPVIRQGSMLEHSD